MTLSKNRETGRSLTEMMGTLSIMGILALTGIWMYNAAMDRLKANTIIQEAQKRAVVVAGQIGFQGRTDPSLGEFSDNTFAGGTFSTNVITNGLYKQFGIQLSGVPKRVCQNILNAIGDTTPMRRLTLWGNPRTPISTCEEDNALLMIYNNNMSDSSGDTAYTCEKDTDCSACGTCNTETHACENDCEAPTPTGGCDFDNECNANNKCMICDTTTRTCKDACTRVEYLITNGSSYVNSGRRATHQTKIEADILITDSNAYINRIFGNYSNFSTAFTLNCGSSNNTSRFGTQQHDVSQLRTISKNVRHTVGNSAQGITLDGTTVYAWTQGTENFQTAGDVALLASTDQTSVPGGLTNGLVGRCYGIKWWENGVLVLDLIPVVNPQDVPALFDRVNQEFHYTKNAAFTAGPTS